MDDPIYIGHMYTATDCLFVNRMRALREKDKNENAFIEFIDNTRCMSSSCGQVGLVGGGGVGLVAVVWGLILDVWALG